MTSIDDVLCLICLLILANNDGDYGYRRQRRIFPSNMASRRRGEVLCRGCSASLWSTPPPACNRNPSPHPGHSEISSSSAFTSPIAWLLYVLPINSRYFVQGDYYRVYQTSVAPFVNIASFCDSPHVNILTSSSFYLGFLCPTPDCQSK